MGEAEKKDYVIPCRIGDQIFEVYAGMVFSGCGIRILHIIR